MKQTAFVLKVWILKQKLFHLYPDVTVFLPHSFHSKLRFGRLKSETKKSLLETLIIKVESTEISNVVRVTVLERAGCYVIHFVDVKVALSVMCVNQ